MTSHDLNETARSKTSFVQFNEEANEELSYCSGPSTALEQSDDEGIHDVENPKRKPRTSFIPFIRNKPLEQNTERSNDYRKANEDIIREPTQCKKTSIFVLGMGSAWVTILPNAMMAASDEVAGGLAVTASVLFAAGGVYGSCVGEFRWLLPAICLQIASILCLRL